MRHFDPESDPHRRRNPLTGQFVLVSPHRTRRPWQGQTEAAASTALPAYDPTCYLCPGNQRAGSHMNPAYPGTFVFDNDFPALLPDVPDARPQGDGDELFAFEPVRGTCRVICFSPRHDLTLAQMRVEDISAVVDTWAMQTSELGKRYPWVQVFENKGQVMGCSNPHPHGQVWAQSGLPNEAAVEDREQWMYLTKHGSPLLLDYAAREIELGTRVVHVSKQFVAVVPFWAVWPFETLVLPRAPVARMCDLTSSARGDLAVLLQAVLGAYDRLFGVSFPYSMGWHGAPFQVSRGEHMDAIEPAASVPADSNHHFQLHAHIYPPLLRSATVKKFMVGYEMLAEPQRDLTAEGSAQRLRELVSPR